MTQTHPEVQKYLEDEVKRRIVEIIKKICPYCAGKHSRYETRPYYSREKNMMMHRPTKQGRPAKCKASVLYNIPI